MSRINRTFDVYYENEITKDRVIIDSRRFKLITFIIKCHTEQDVTPGTEQIRVLRLQFPYWKVGDLKTFANQMVWSESIMSNGGL